MDRVLAQLDGFEVSCQFSPFFLNQAKLPSSSIMTPNGGVPVRQWDQKQLYEGFEMLSEVVSRRTLAQVDLEDALEVEISEYRNKLSEVDRSTPE